MKRFKDYAIMIKIARIDGDGIGKEVTEAGVAVLESLDLNFDFLEAEAGRECFDKNGTTIPDDDRVDSLAQELVQEFYDAIASHRLYRNAKATLFGAITSTPGQKSPIITLRQELDTYANLRPIKSFKGINCLFDDLDFLIVRENTEGLYSGNETIDDGKEKAKGGYDDFRSSMLEKFNKSQNEMQDKYKSFREEALKGYIDFMRKSWEKIEGSKPVPAPVIEPVPPVVRDEDEDAEREKEQELLYIQHQNFKMQ